MEARPPYMFTTAVRDPERSYLALINDVDSAVIEVAVHGRWSRRLAVDASIAVRKCVVELPRAVIVDLHDMGDGSGESIPLWISEYRAANGMQPPVQVVLCAPTQTAVARRLRHVGASRYLPMYATMPEARAALTNRTPITDLLRRRLPPDLSSASVARDMVGQACQAWNLGEVLHQARLVISELVANAAEHARTEMLVSISRRGAGLHLSVSDRDPRAPRLLGPVPATAQEPGDESYRGLHLVHQCASAWGSMPTADGKVVWATIRHRERRTS